MNKKIYFIFTLLIIILSCKDQKKSNSDENYERIKLEFNDEDIKDLITIDDLFDKKLIDSLFANKEEQYLKHKYNSDNSIELNYSGELVSNNKAAIVNSTTYIYEFNLDIEQFLAFNKGHYYSFVNEENFGIVETNLKISNTDLYKTYDITKNDSIIGFSILFYKEKKVSCVDVMYLDKSNLIIDKLNKKISSHF